MGKRSSTRGFTMRLPPRIGMRQLLLEFMQSAGFFAISSAYSCGMKVSCSQPRIESKPPMKKRRSGYVHDDGGGVSGGRFVKSHACVLTFSPRRSSAANETCLKIGRYPAKVCVSRTKWAEAWGAGGTHSWASCVEH